MPWFKVDDQLAFNPKVLEAGNAAMGLWVRAGSWCAANLTDGQLPAHMIGTLGAQKRNARSLVESGLWVETESGYRFKNWSEFQPTKAEILRERAETAERVRKHREAKRNAVTNSVSNGSSTAAPTRPDPTHI